MTRQEAIQKASDILGEHFDNFQILVTWSECDESYFWSRGGGNWFARQGMAHEFINSDVAQGQARKIAERLNPGDEY